MSDDSSGPSGSEECELLGVSVILRYQLSEKSAANPLRLALNPMRVWRGDD